MERNIREISLREQCEARVIRLQYGLRLIDKAIYSLEDRLIDLRLSMRDR